jgi:hypothetical protein
MKSFSAGTIPPARRNLAGCLVWLGKQAQGREAYDRGNFAPVVAAGATVPSFFGVPLINTQLDRGIAMANVAATSQSRATVIIRLGERAVDGRYPIGET